jgi:hypothetical protein
MNVGGIKNKHGTNKQKQIKETKNGWKGKTMIEWKIHSIDKIKENTFIIGCKKQSLMSILESRR